MEILIEISPSLWAVEMTLTGTLGSIASYSVTLTEFKTNDSII